MKHILLFLLCLCSQTFSWAQDIYVATNGSDNLGNGSISNPYKTIQYASQQAMPGTHVYVRGGTYQNQSFNDGDIWNGDNVANIEVNGTSSAYITFQPYNNEQVIIEFDDTYGILIKNSSYVKLIGFEFKGISNQITLQEAQDAWGLYKDINGVIHDLQTEMGIDISNPALIGQTINKSDTPDISKPNYYNGRALVANKSHHIELLNNLVYDVPSAAIRAQQSDYITISGNKVYNNTYWTTQGVGAITISEATVAPIGDTNTDVKIKLINNEVYGNENRMVSWNPTKTFVKFEVDEGTGLFLTRNNATYTNGKMLIANNLSYQNGASGIVCHFTDRVLIEHNTVFDNGTTNTGTPGGIGVNTSDDVKIINNISYSKSEKWALGILANPVTNLIKEGNIIFNNNGAESTAHNIADGWIETNPLFTNQSNFDFTLAQNSPGINAGSVNATQTEDYLGNPRNDGQPDIGAYETQEALSTESDNVDNLKIFPNPFINTITISGFKTQPNIIVLYNTLAQQLDFEIPLNTSKSLIINTKNLNSGIYVLSLDGVNFRLLKK